VDYYAFALVQLLQYIYGHTVKDMIANKPQLHKWIDAMKERPNILAYFNRPRIIPVSNWQINQ